MAGGMKEHFALKSDNSGELICTAERSRRNQIIMDFLSRALAARSVPNDVLRCLTRKMKTFHKNAT